MEGLLQPVGDKLKKSPSVAFPYRTTTSSSDDDNWRERLAYILLKEPGCVPLAWLLKRTFGIEPMHALPGHLKKRGYRLVQKWAKDGLVKLSKADGLVWVQANHELVNLILCSQNSNQRPPDLARPFRSYSRMHELKFEGVRELKRFKDDFSERALKSSMIGYLREARLHRVVLAKKVVRDDLGYFVDDFLVLPYRTRFTDRGRVVRLLRRFDEVWRYADDNYSRGVHLVLTCDPGLFHDRFEAVKHLNKVFNNFMSWVKKRFPRRGRRRWDYVKVLEFTDNGWPHFHIVVWGLRRLADFREISREWERLYAGRVIYVYSIKKGKKGWSWVKDRPENVREGQTLKSYLKKYLKKVLYEVMSVERGCLENIGKIIFYWASDCRFYTYSFSILHVLGPRFKVLEAKVRVVEWVFLFACHELDAPGWLKGVLDHLK